MRMWISSVVLLFALSGMAETPTASPTHADFDPAASKTNERYAAPSEPQDNAAKLSRYINACIQDRRSPAPERPDQILQRMLQQH
jgi:cytochrome P450